MEVKYNSYVAPPRMVVPQCCKVCDGALTIGGPIWTDPIHNIDFIKKFLPII